MIDRNGLQLGVQIVAIEVYAIVLKCVAPLFYPDKGLRIVLWRKSTWQEKATSES